MGYAAGEEGGEHSRPDRRTIARRILDATDNNW